MNFYKSVFISVFISWLAGVSLYALIETVRGIEPLLSWMGLALSALAPLVFFINAFLFKSPRTSRFPIEYSALSGLGVAITMAMSYRHQQAAGVIHVWAGFTLVGWLLYLRWYSIFRHRDSLVLRVGSPLPDFRLENLQGHVVSSQSFMASPHLLIFYRGNWCPFCTAQIEELGNVYKKLESLGLKVVLISPQSNEKSQSLALKFKVPMVFLRDRNGNAAKLLGIDHPWGTPMGLQLLGYGSDSVLPTVILTNDEGRIIYSDQTDNYRVRPDPKSFEVVMNAL